MSLDPMLVYRSKPQGGVYKRGRMQRLWMRDVKVGDVLKSPSGTLRVVRKVKRYENGDLSYIGFTKKAPGKFASRGGTSYNYTDLRLQGWAPTGARVELGSENDFLFEVETTLLPYPPVFSYAEARDMP